MVDNYVDGVLYPGSSGTEYTLKTPTDTTLSVEGEAADAKATGDAIIAATVEIDDTLTQSGEAADAKVVGDSLATKAEADGSYDSMTVGNAEQLISSVYEEDSVPYTFRTSGGAIDIGDREEDKIIGGTVAWNQIAKELIGSNYNKGAGTAVYDNGTVSFTAASQYGALYGLTLSPLVNGHKYLINSDMKFTNAAGANTVRVAIGATGYNQGAVYIPSTSPVNAFINLSGVVQYNPGTNPTNNFVFLQDNRAETSQIDMKNLMLIDLTQMFGSAIADYIYSLEQSTAGAGVAWFRKLFPKDYYAYNAGELLSVSDLQSHDMVGFNQFDKGTAVSGRIDSNGQVSSASGRSVSGFIRVVPGMTYYVNNIISSTNGRGIFCYDSNKDGINVLIPTGVASATSGTFTIPSNAMFVRLGMLDQNIDSVCINLSWDGERDGEYEPYVKHSYPLDDSLTLRGIPKLDADNKLYYDGDVYESDGTVTRRYGIVDLGTLTYAKSSLIENGFVAIAGMPDDFPIAPSTGSTPKWICGKYRVYTNVGIEASGVDKAIAWRVAGSNKGVIIRDNAYATYYANNNMADFKTAMSGVYLVYELATPTTESADPYQNPQIVDDFGTEEYVTTSIVPVGHETKYQPNLRAKLEMAPNSPDGNGDYIVRHTNGENVYVPLAFPADELPQAPTENGTYRLTVTVSNGTASYAWVSV